MEIVQVLSFAAIASSIGFLAYQAVKWLSFDKNTPIKAFQIINRRTGKQTTMPVKPSKAEVKKVLEVIES